MRGTTFFVLSALLGLGGATSAAPKLQPMLTLEDPTPLYNAQFGLGLAGIGDVNGDHVPDIVVGAPGQDIGSNVDQGQAFVFSGLDGSLLRTLNDPFPKTNAYFGASVAGVGDVSGDGVPDIAVGANGQVVIDGLGCCQGEAFVFSGADGAHLLTLDDPYVQAVAYYASAISGAGDVSGDGVPDIYVGAYDQDIVQGDEGRAFLYSGVDGSLLRVVDDPIVPGEDAHFASCIERVGDVTHDGIDDVVVGATNQDFHRRNHGRAFLLSGADGSLHATLDTPYFNRTSNPRFGCGASAMGDVNGDGTPDVVVGAGAQTVTSGDGSPGRAFVFSGTDGSLLTVLKDPREQPEEFFGLDVAGVGDIDHDGVPDVAVAASLKSFGIHFAQGQVLVLSGSNGVVLRVLSDPVNELFSYFGKRLRAVGDLTGDGVSELAVTARSDPAGNLDQGQVFIFNIALP